MGPIQSSYNQLISTILGSATRMKGLSQLKKGSENIKGIRQDIGDSNKLINAWREELSKGKTTEDTATAAASAGIDPDQLSMDLSYITSDDINAAMPKGFEDRQRAMELSYKRIGNEKMADEAVKKIKNKETFNNVKEMLYGDRGEILG